VLEDAGINEKIMLQTHTPQGHSEGNACMKVLVQVGWIVFGSDDSFSAM